MKAILVKEKYLKGIGDEKDFTEGTKLAEKQEILETCTIH